MRLSLRVSLLIVGFLPLGLPACGGPRTYPVKGKIVHDGKPVPRGSVMFTPMKGGPTATGDIGPDGTYRLTTYKPGDGAPVGEYRVAIMAMESMEGRELNNPAQSLIPDKYTSVALSGLTAAVHETDNVCDFTLTGAVKKAAVVPEVVPKGKKILAEQAARKEKAEKKAGP